MALFALTPLPEPSPIPTDVDMLMREIEEEIQPRPQSQHISTLVLTEKVDQKTVDGTDTFPVARPRRLQELAGPSRIDQSSPRKDSLASVASSRVSTRTDDQSYATARESMSEAESSEYYTAREGMSTSDSLSTLKSDGGGDVRQIESDVESVFSAGPATLSGSRETLVREDSLDELQRLEERRRSVTEREVTPVNEDRTGVYSKRQLFLIECVMVKNCW